MDLRQLESGAAGSPPTAPSSPSVGHPTAGVPGSTPAGIPGPYWFYQIAESLRRIQILAGQTPDHLDLDQLRDALVALFAAKAGASAQVFSAADGASGKQVVNISQFATSFGSSGYARFPGGLVVQWGIASAVGTPTVPFPIAFPTACLTVLASDTGASNYAYGTSALSATSFILSGAGSARYIALGY